MTATSRLRRSPVVERENQVSTMIGQFTDAIKVYRQALECHRTLGDRRKQGNALRALSRPL
jgi:hypothetical protein